jgi:hypothetical protein
MKRIYMNHLIRERSTKEPVIAIEDDLSDGVLYANAVDIMGPSRIVHGKLAGKAGHDVKVWIETRAKLGVS